jgi:hypothetical protein
MNAQLLQLLISVAGIAMMIGLCRLLFGSKETSLDNVAAVTERLARDIPGFRAGHATLSRDARSALIENVRDGQIYLAVTRGDDLVTRKLARGIHVAREGDRIELIFDDFTLRDAQLDLADAPVWETKLKALAA